jgi:hypothetical protein
MGKNIDLVEVLSRTGFIMVRKRTMMRGLGISWRKA